MALAGNTIISQNKILISITSSLPKLIGRNHHHHHHHCNPNKFQSNLPSLFFQPNIRISTLAFSPKATASHVEVQSSNPSASTSAWSEFTRNVSGEWDGFGADFTMEGKPIELPENVVPEAYREWEVKVFDWQTQCPTLAQQDELDMSYANIKLLPTVGCEADASTRYSVDERNINKASAFAYQSSGCYVAVWPVVDHNGSYERFELEHCLINPLDRESRVRIIQVVRVANAKMELENVIVFREQWYGPFRNGDQLGGCAIRDSAFASTDALKASEIIGVWQGPTAVAKFDTLQTNFYQELSDDGVVKSTRDERDLVLLPKQLWCLLKQSRDGGETHCEAGWVFDHGYSLTSRCIFSSDAMLKESSIARETESSEGI